MEKMRARLSRRLHILQEEGSKGAVSIKLVYIILSSRKEVAGFIGNWRRNRQCWCSEWNKSHFFRTMRGTNTPPYLLSCGDLPLRGCFAIGG